MEYYNYYHESSDVPGRKRLVVPKHLQKLLLDEYHDAPFTGHFGVKKLAGRLAQYYYWVGMKSDAHKNVQVVSHALLFKDKVTERDHL